MNNKKLQRNSYSERKGLLRSVLEVPFKVQSKITQLSTKGRINKVIASTRIKHTPELSIYQFLLEENHE
ncbi:MAG: hypothetical protein AB4057_10910 [Crocosphaera sp.]